MVAYFIWLYFQPFDMSSDCISSQDTFLLLEFDHRNSDALLGPQDFNLLV